MHELSLCEAIADSATRHADGRGVNRVSVRIGHLRQVVPDALQLAWEVLTAGTALEGAELDIDHVPATIRCGACGQESELAAPVMLCPACGSADVAVLTGDELLVVSLELVGA